MKPGVGKQLLVTTFVATGILFISIEILGNILALLF